jgi:hypothetical protein
VIIFAHDRGLEFVTTDGRQRGAMDEELFCDDIARWTHHRLGTVTSAAKLRYSAAFSPEQITWLFDEVGFVISTLKADSEEK